MSYAIACKGQGRCDCCPGYDDPQLCDDPGLRLLKEVCVGFDTCLDGAVFPYPYSCLYYGSSGCAMACLDRGAQLPIPLLFAFLTTTEQGFPWWDEEAHAGCFVAKLPLEGIQRLRGRIRVDYDLTLAAMPTYPIIRARLRFWPATGPLVMAALFDIGAKEHMRVLVHLSAQQAFHVHLHRDDTLAYVYSKLCPLEPSLQEKLDAMVAEAKRQLAAIPEDERNFQRAKHAFHAVMGM
jgi:hypothetical protein